MKTRLKCLALGCLLPAICLSTHAQGPAFTYQGRLNNTNGIPASGSYDFQFGLWNAALTPAQILANMNHSLTAQQDSLAGVALAAIQGLNQKVEEDQAMLHGENERLKQRNRTLELRLERVEQFLETQTV